MSIFHRDSIIAGQEAITAVILQDPDNEGLFIIQVRGMYRIQYLLEPGSQIARFNCVHCARQAFVTIRRDLKPIYQGPDGKPKQE